MTDDRVLTAVHDGVATITLNRPDKLNAFAGDMRERLAAALDRVGADAGARVLVLTGAGRAFCAGGDVQHMAQAKASGAGPEALEPLLAAGRAVIERLVALPIPTVAAVNGVAAGAGMNLALACDLRIASDEATFAESFARIGLTVDWGGSWFLPRAVGLGKALELAWLAERVDAHEALRIGLVERVVPQARFADQVAALARQLAAAPAASLRASKRVLRAALHTRLAQAFELEAEAQAECWRAPDVAEGLRAFVEKRAPAFEAAAVPAAMGSAWQSFE